VSGRLGDRVERAIEERADEHALERAEAAAPPEHRLRRTVFWLAITGASLYLVAPSVIEVLGSYDDLGRLAHGWLAAMVVAQASALACLWVLQRLAIHARGWYPIVTSQLAANALGKVAPGGGALGAALQYRMLVAAGVQGPAAVSGLTATGLLTFAVVLAMPLLAVPALIRGSVDDDLLRVSAVGLGLFVVLAVAGTAVLALDRPLGWIGRAVQRVRNRLRPSAEPLRQLPARLMRERDRILETVGPKWRRALLATVGRWTFDYLTLLAAVAAVGGGARPGLVLLAFCAAQVLTQVPVTPGGLGFVEAGLTAMLALAGVSAGDAVLATFTYRLFSYWLPLPVGLAAYGWYQRLVRRPAAATPPPG
jgi:uncharacterized protein (TIRG00374 family)